MQDDKDYYSIVGVDPNASFEQIKEAYLFRVNILHPDRMAMMPEGVRTRAEEELKQVNRAYEILSNPSKRSKYDNARRISHVEMVGERVNAGKAANTAKPKPEVYPKTVKFDKALPYVWQKGTFFIRNVGGPFTKVVISAPPDWLKITETKQVLSGQKLPLEIKLEAMGIQWGKKSRTQLKVRLDEVETVVNVELRVTDKPR